MHDQNATFIIEDNSGDMLLLKEQLQACGWITQLTRCETNLSDAINTLKNLKPAIILLDLNLPDSNGLETFLTIQSVAPNVPIIILSGVADQSLAIQAVQAGAQDFLVKGEFEEKLLLKTILYSIERKKSQLKIADINKRFTYASKATNDALWDWDIKTNEILWNDKVKMFGYHDAISKNELWRSSNIHPDDKERVINNLNTLLNSPLEQWNQQYRFRCADGSYKYIYDRGYVLRDRNKQPYRIIGTMQDVSVQILLQQKLEYEKEQQQKAILKTTIESQEKERNEIGKELHENVNKILKEATLRLKLVEAETNPSGLVLIKETQDLIIKAVDEIRKLTHNIVTSHIDDAGLVVAIENLIDEIKSLQTFNLKVVHNIINNKIPYPVALTVYRILQEQLSNIKKHSAATEAVIHINLKEEVWMIEITDNGIGASADALKNGVGITNIINRTAVYNGKVSIDTAPQKGFKLIVQLRLN